jgi:hypothetical protein
VLYGADIELVESFPPVGCNDLLRLKTKHHNSIQVARAIKRRKVAILPGPEPEASMDVSPDLHL